MKDIIATIKEQNQTLIKNGGKKVKTKVLGQITLILASLLNRELKYLMPFINQEINIDGSQLTKLLELEYEHTAKESIKEMTLKISEMINEKDDVK